MKSMAKPVGRPSGLNDKIQEIAINLAKEGKTIQQIANALGVCRRTMNNWLGANPEFMHALKASASMADELVEATLFNRALGYTHPEEKIFCQDGIITRVKTFKHYPPDPTAMIFWLKNRQPAKWRDRREIEIDGTLETKSSFEEQAFNELEMLLKLKDSGR